MAEERYEMDQQVMKRERTLPKIERKLQVPNSTLLCAQYRELAKIGEVCRFCKNIEDAKKAAKGCAGSFEKKSKDNAKEAYESARI